MRDNWISLPAPYRGRTGPRLTRREVLRGRYGPRRSYAVRFPELLDGAFSPLSPSPSVEGFSKPRSQRIRPVSIR